jgi:hypothetical protein
MTNVKTTPSSHKPSSAIYPTIISASSSHPAQKVSSTAALTLTTGSNKSLFDGSNDIRTFQEEFKYSRLGVAPILRNAYSRQTTSVKSSPAPPPPAPGPRPCLTSQSPRPLCNGYRFGVWYRRGASGTDGSRADILRRRTGFLSSYLRFLVVSKKSGGKRQPKRCC